MKPAQMANLMYKWGWVIRHEHYIAFCDYLKEMVKRNRVFIVKDEEEIIALCFYFLTDDFNEVYKKGTWDVIEDDPSGHQIYIDKLVCRTWTRKVRESVQEAIQTRFPQVAEGYYHRAPKDRCVKILRGDKYELQSTVS